MVPQRRLANMRNLFIKTTSVCFQVKGEIVLVLLSAVLLVGWLTGFDITHLLEMYLERK